MKMSMIKLLVATIVAACIVGLPLDASARGHGGGGYYGGGGGGHRSSGGSSFHPRAARAPSYHAPHVRSPQVREHYVSHFPKSKPARVRQSHSNSDYRDYRKEVDRVTSHNFRKNRASIDPGHTRGKRGGNDLDHRTPVKQCFDRGMSAAQCADPSNLRMLEAHQNRSEGCRGCRKGH